MLKMKKILLFNSEKRVLVWTEIFLMFSAVLSTDDSADIGNGLENSRFVENSEMSCHKT